MIGYNNYGVYNFFSECLSITFRGLLENEKAILKQKQTVH
jgi:hypothetical protein